MATITFDTPDEEFVSKHRRVIEDHLVTQEHLNTRLRELDYQIGRHDDDLGRNSCYVG